MRPGRILALLLLATAAALPAATVPIPGLR